MPVRSCTSATDTPLSRARRTWKMRSGVGVRSAASDRLPAPVGQPVIRCVRRGGPAGPVRFEPAERLLEAPP